MSDTKFDFTDEDPTLPEATPTSEQVADEWRDRWSKVPTSERPTREMRRPKVQS